MLKKVVTLLLVIAIIFMAVTYLFSKEFRQPANDSQGPTNSPPIDSNTIALLTPPSCASFNELTGNLINSEELKNWANDPELIVIDGRESSRINISPSPLSLNLEFRLLKTKDYLKSKKILLIDEPFARRAGLEAAHTLTSLGFKDVKLLSGGIKRWVAADLPTNGDVKLADQSRVITPKQFLTEASFSPWVLVETTTDKTATEIVIEKTNILLKSSLIKQISVNSPSSNEELLSNIMAIYQKEILNNSLLVIALEASAVAQGRIAELDRLLLEANADGVFLMEGGMPGLTKFFDEVDGLMKFRQENLERMKCGA